MTILVEQLQEVRALLEAGWCQGALARAGNNREVPPESSTAVRFCLVGAIQRVWQPATPLWPLTVAINKALPGSTATSFWNDTPGRTKAQVLALVDRAIAKAVAP